MSQEFLASFAVDIDESGVNRLQSILSQNRDLAAGLASAFDAATCLKLTLEEALWTLTGFFGDGGSSSRPAGSASSPPPARI